MLRSRNNVTILQAIAAIARAQIRMPGFDHTRAKDAAVKVDAVLADTRGMECVVALCIVLLKALGYDRTVDESFFRP